MTIETEILDWPALVAPYGQIFHAGGQGHDGGFTGGGFATILPEPGGRAILELTFNTMKSEVPARLAAWLISRMRNGTVFRVPIRRTPQLASLADLGLTGLSSLEQDGVPWEDGQSWETGENWAFEIVGTAPAAALEGVTEIVTDLSGLNQGLQIGHLIGHKSATYHVDAISYSGDVATISINPPLRSDMEIGDIVTLRPFMLAYALDPEAFKAAFDPARMIKPGSVVMVEALL